MPIPPTHHIVQFIGIALVVHRHLVEWFAICTKGSHLYTRAILIRVVGIEVRLHVEQL